MDNDLQSCELMKLHLIGTDKFEKNYQIAIEYLLKALDEGSVQCKDKYYEMMVSKKEFGKSFEERFFILEEKSKIGIPIEYELLSKIYGEKDVDYFVEKQEVGHRGESWIDIIHIELLNGEKVSYYFDITLCFGK